MGCCQQDQHPFILVVSFFCGHCLCIINVMCTLFLHHGFCLIFSCALLSNHYSLFIFQCFYRILQRSGGRLRKQSSSVGLLGFEITVRLFTFFEDSWRDWLKTGMPDRIMLAAYATGGMMALKFKLKRVKCIVPQSSQHYENLHDSQTFICHPTEATFSP